MAATHRTRSAHCWNQPGKSSLNCLSTAGSTVPTLPLNGKTSSPLAPGHDPSHNQHLCRRPWRQFCRMKPVGRLMRLALSIASDSRQFSRMMRRVRPRIQPLLDAFPSVELCHPIHDQLLVGVSNSLPADHCEIVPNSDSYFQVAMGWPADSDLSPTGDDANITRLAALLRRAVTLCPFSDPDSDAMLALFNNWSA